MAFKNGLANRPAPLNRQSRYVNTVCSSGLVKGNTRILEASFSVNPSVRPSEPVTFEESESVRPVGGGSLMGVRVATADVGWLVGLFGLIGWLVGWFIGSLPVTRRLSSGLRPVSSLAAFSLSFLLSLGRPPLEPDSHLWHNPALHSRNPCAP